MYTPDESALMDEMENYFMEKMDERRENVKRKVSERIREDLIEPFMKLLIAAHDESLPEVDFFINSLRISEVDIACLKNDKRAFKEFMLQELESERADQY